MNVSVAKAATETRTFRRPALFYRSAREGFEDLLRHRLNAGADGVLLPAFIGWSPREGSGVFDPVRNSGSRYGFYGLNADLTVDMTSLRGALEGGRWTVLVLIHYFGRTEPELEAVGALAREHGTLLVEDLAHGFFSAQSGGPAGSVGAVSLYSLHKMFAVPAGGMLTYADPLLVNGQKETAPELARTILDYDWTRIADRRRENFLAIAQRLQGLKTVESFSLLWPDLGPTDAPQTLPVRITGGDRDKVYHRMNEQGFGMTSLYHTLIDEIGNDFPEMTALSKAIINFPVHQDVTPEGVDAMIESFQFALNAS